MKIAKRLEKIPPYLFVEISKKIAQKKSQGIEIINFGIGDPDLPTPEMITFPFLQFIIVFTVSSKDLPKLFFSFFNALISWSITSLAIDLKFFNFIFNVTKYLP